MQETLSRCTFSKFPITQHLTTLSIMPRVETFPVQSGDHMQSAEDLEKGQHCCMQCAGITISFYWRTAINPEATDRPAARLIG